VLEPRLDLFLADDPELYIDTTLICCRHLGVLTLQTGFALGSFNAPQETKEERRRGL